MKVISDRIEMIFRNEKDGKVFYSVGMPTKKQDGTYENNYGNIKFRNDVSLENKTKIKIKEAWLGCYKNNLYIFVNDFEKVEEQPKEKKDDGWVSAKDIEIDEDELPFY